VRTIELLTVVLTLMILGCNQTGNFEKELRGESKLNIQERRDGVIDIFGPELAFEFVTKDSSNRHSLAILESTTDSIRFVLLRQDRVNLFEYFGYAIRNNKGLKSKPQSTGNFNDFITQGDNHIVHIRIAADRQKAEVVYLDKGEKEVARVSSTEIVDRYENAR